MKKNLLFSVCMVLSIIVSNAQGVGIGTNNPDSTAALDVSSSSKGFLYPRLTISQRNAILNPADGLHIYNTDSGVPEYYDGKLKLWICLGAMCSQNVTWVRIKGEQKNPVNITQGVYGIDTTKSDSIIVILTVEPGAILYKGLAFYNLNIKARVILYNYGSIYGTGGSGGDAEIQSTAINCTTEKAKPGTDGHSAVRAYIYADIYNYGIIAGGGGGGAGAGKGGNTSANGGGGGCGIGYSDPLNDNPVIKPGKGGITYNYTIADGCQSNYLIKGSDGKYGSVEAAGKGGEGINSGTAGGNGGGWGQPGKSVKGGAAGGKAGFAIETYYNAKVMVYSYPGSSILGPVKL